MTTTEASPGAVLIVAPIGKDAALAVQALERVEIRAKACLDLNEAALSLGEPTAALLIAEEALVAAKLPVLLDALQHQPPWSDVPVIVLTTSGGSDRMSRQAVDIFGPAGNVTLLERPLRGVTLISAMKVALRARRRQYEARDLLEQRERLLASISDAFSSLDREWRYIYVNDRVAELARLPREKMLGREIWEIFPDAIGGEFHHLAHQAMQERKAVQGQLFFKPWGRWLETRIYPTNDGIAVFSADITERKHQELLAREHDLKLKESEDLLRLATEAAAIGTFDYYPQTGELRLSERARELFGLAAGAKVDYVTYFGALHPEDQHLIAETAQRAVQPGNNGRYSIEYRTIGISDGKERWVAEAGRVLLDPSGQAQRFIGTLLDITEEKNAELLLQRAKREAEEANRAKDQFLAMLSHELRTPLTPVLMTIASLRRQPDLSEDLYRDLEVLQRNVELEALLIDDLLDLTRIAHGKLELHNDAVDIHTTVEHALNISTAEIAEKKLSVTRRFEALEHHCWADAARLQQVFWNLIKNAVKFTPPGGRLTVRTQNDREHHVVVSVTDTGIGIEPEIISRIFDAFEQGGRSTTHRFGGLGLGLAISKRVVDLHDGTIAAESAGLGEGATLTVTLNAMQTSLLEGPVTYLESDSIATETASILLVEDHEDTSRVLRRILENAGYEVSHAGSLARARELAEGAAFDLVISDLGLPDGNGADLMQFLRAQYGLTGIALSGFGTDDDVSTSAAAGFAEHLTKPVDWPQLRNAIGRLLAERARKRAGAMVIT